MVPGRDNRRPHRSHHLRLWSQVSDVTEGGGVNAVLQPSNRNVLAPVLESSVFFASYKDFSSSSASQAAAGHGPTGPSDQELRAF